MTIGRRHRRDRPGERADPGRARALAGRRVRLPRAGRPVRDDVAGQPRRHRSRRRPGRGHGRPPRVADVDRSAVLAVDPPTLRIAPDGRHALVASGVERDVAGPSAVATGWPGSSSWTVRRSAEPPESMPSRSRATNAISIPAPGSRSPPPTRSSRAAGRAAAGSSPTFQIRRYALSGRDLGPVDGDPALGDPEQVLIDSANGVAFTWDPRDAHPVRPGPRRRAAGDAPGRRATTGPRRPTSIARRRPAVGRDAAGLDGWAGRDGQGGRTNARRVGRRPRAVRDRRGRHARLVVRRPRVRCPDPAAARALAGPGLLPLAHGLRARPVRRPARAPGPDRRPADRRSGAPRSRSTTRTTGSRSCGSGDIGAESPMGFPWMPWTADAP